MRRNEKWPVTVFHRLLDRSIFPDPVEVVPFPSTFGQKHFSHRIKYFLLQAFRQEHFSWSRINISFSSDFPTKIFPFPSTSEMVFIFNPSCFHYASPDCCFWLTRSDLDEDIFIPTHHCKTIYLVFAVGCLLSKLSCSRGDSFIQYPHKMRMNQQIWIIFFKNRICTTSHYFPFNSNESVCSNVTPCQSKFSNADFLVLDQLLGPPPNSPVPMTSFINHQLCGAWHNSDRQSYGTM